MEKEFIEKLNKEIETAIKNRDFLSLRELFEVNPIQDIALAMDEIKIASELLFVFRVVSSDYTAELFSELTIEQQELLVNSFQDNQIKELLENAFTDDIVDVLQELPANLVSRILKIASPKDRKDINRLLNYKDNTAGSIMTTEYLSLFLTDTVKEAIERIRKEGRQAETIYTIFVRDKNRNLVGTLDLDELIFSNETITISEIMNKDFKTANVNDDQEDIALMFKRYNLNAMAVLNSEQKVCGIITVDDVVDVISKEAAEDITAISNVSNIETTYLETPVWRLTLKCAPWIIVLMVLQVFSSMILSGFQDEIARFAILSIFTPLIMDASGNSGGQTTGLMVRSLSLDEFKRGDGKKVIWKEFRVASFIGAIVAVFGFGWLMFEMSVGIVQCHVQDFPSITLISDVQLHLLVSLLVGITLFISILVSKLAGVLLCLLCQKIKKDPAVMAQPLVTTLVDISSLLSYFLLWSLVFGPMIGL